MNDVWQAHNNSIWLCQSPAINQPAQTAVTCSVVLVPLRHQLMAATGAGRKAVALVAENMIPALLLQGFLLYYSVYCRRDTEPDPNGRRGQ